MKIQIALSILTAMSASMCCITPVLAIIAGTSSIATSFHWIEPFRPYLISLTVLVLGFAWFQSFSRTKDDCGCEPTKKKSIFYSRTTLSLVTIISFLLITFPSYSKFLLHNSTNHTAPNQDTNRKVELKVFGMTCASCELHIENEVSNLNGVSFVKASYKNGSTIVEFNGQKVDADKIIATINKTGYKVEGIPNKTTLLQDQTANCCSNGTCKDHLGKLPSEENKNLRVISNITEVQKPFNAQNGKVKFVAILSPTCGWCLSGAESVQKTVIEKMKSKDIDVIIVWTSMVKTDDQSAAYKAASLFKDQSIIQFFDSENLFGDIVARRLNPQGNKAWDIYMFFDGDTQWGKEFPRPFEYAHQLHSPAYPWADKTKYFCGNELTKRLDEIINAL